MSQMAAWSVASHPITCSYPLSQSDYAINVTAGTPATTEQCSSSSSFQILLAMSEAPNTNVAIRNNIMVARVLTNFLPFLTQKGLYDLFCINLGLHLLLFSMYYLYYYLMLYQLASGFVNSQPRSLKYNAWA